jgi:hypothetical protein
MLPNELPPHAQLMKNIVGRWISKPIYVAAELGIADILADGPKPVAELASLTSSHSPSLYRVMRALASVGIFKELENESFTHTPVSEFLKSGMLRSAAILFNADWSDKAWEHFLEGVRTGETPFQKAYGIPLTEWLQQNPDKAAVFNDANAVKAASTHRAIVEVYDFSGIHKLMDLGGGTGLLLLEVLKMYSSLEGVVADVQPVITETQKHIDNSGLSARCKGITCDFFHRVPSGFDAIMLSNILHDWPDEDCVRILGNCRQALALNDTLLIVEMIVPGANIPSVAKLLDMEMLTITGGKERTEAEYNRLLELTGFRLNRIIPAPENVFIIEGIAV